jgi:hypothetical protein
VTLNSDSYDLWLDPGMKDVLAVLELLGQFGARLMRCYPVSNRTNYPPSKLVLEPDADFSANSNRSVNGAFVILITGVTFACDLTHRCNACLSG